MRRKDRQRTCAFAQQVLDACMYATLAMTDMQGRPYCVPINPVREGDALYFHAAMEGKKTDCLRNNPAVCIAAVGRTRVPAGKFTMQYESAIATGRAEEVTDTEMKIHALRLLCQKFAPADMGAFDEAVARSLTRTAVWRVRLQTISGKCKPYEGWDKQSGEGNT